MTAYGLLFDHILRRMPPETAHRVAAVALRGAARLPRRRNPAIEVRALGLTFPSPLGAAAGLDKGATFFEGLGAVGFGFVEVGTLTPQPQEGNPKPRVWRLVEDRALINAMGFPNPGAAAAAARMRKRRTIVGANIGKAMETPLEDASADYRAAAETLAPVADFVVLNVSSPNTVGLRDLQAADRLAALLDAIATDKPVLVKLAPDLADADLDAIADAAVAHGAAGIVAVNTTTSRVGLHADAGHPGGVSGAPLKGRALAVLRRLHARVGDRVTLVSVGGIETADDAWERILAGATLVQAYTAFVYGGPLWPHRVNRELARRVRAAGARNVQELVGSGGAGEGGLAGAGEHGGDVRVDRGVEPHAEV